VSAVEILGFVTGAACVWLATRQNIWNYPIGIANNIAFLVLFGTHGLYADAALQIFYIAVALVGWWSWLRGGPRYTALRVQAQPSWGWPAVAVGTAGTALLIYGLLSRHTDSTVPQWDALTTALSIVAQLMLNRKWIGNWYVWITADVIYVCLYAAKGLWLTAALYVGFIALCIEGLRAWRVSMRTAPEGEPIV
jgi:nicotinamide mononucleotide transporter